MALPRTPVSEVLAVADSRASKVRGIPEDLFHCVEEIEYNCLFVKDIYRTPAVYVHLKELEQYAKEGHLKYKVASVSAHATAALVKHILAGIGPLVPQDQQNNFASIATRLRQQSAPNDSFVDELRRIVNKLPDTNQAVLSYLIHHLKRVHNEAKYNGMDSRSLAAIFGPIIFAKPILGKPGLIPDQMKDMRYLVGLMDYMIIHGERIFEQRSFQHFIEANSETPDGQKGGLGNFDGERKSARDKLPASGRGLRRSLSSVLPRTPKKRPPVSIKNAESKTEPETVAVVRM